MIKPMSVGHDDVEVLYGIFLDIRNRVIDIQPLSKGTLTSTVAYPREIVKKILELKAAALILVHNHPSGDLEPSSEDKVITYKLALVLYALGVSLHNHIIVGNGYHSMAESGALTHVQDEFRKLLG